MPTNDNTFKDYYINAGLLVICLAVTCFYISLSTPGIGWRDGPEFTVTSAYLDIGHPSGFPTYNLLSKIITWLPLGAIGFKVTIFTALMGGLSIFIFSLLLKKLHCLDKQNKKTAISFVLLPLLLYSLDSAIFMSSTELEVYSLNTFFILTLFFFAVKWHTGNGIAWLYSGAFIYGLASGNHSAIGLYLPILLLLTIFGEPPDERQKGAWGKHVKRIFILLAFFLIGISVYFYLIIRSQTDHLPVDFGRTDTLHRFWLHITDAKDSETHFQGMFKPEDLKYYLPIQIKNLFSPLFWFSIPFLAWGIKYLWKQYQILSVALPSLILINLLFFYYWIDGSSAFLPSITAYFILVSIGFGEFGRLVFTLKPYLKRGICLIVMLFFLISASIMAKNHIENNDSQSGFLSTELYFDDLAKLPPDSVVVHALSWFAELSLQNIYGLRPDVTLVFMSGITDPDIMVYPEPIKMPLVEFPKYPNGDFITPTDPDFANAFFLTNMSKGKRVFFQYGPLVDSYLYYLKPQDDFLWLAELKMDPLAGLNAMEDGQYDKWLTRHKEYSQSLMSNKDEPVAKKAIVFLYYNLSKVLDFLYENGEYEKTYDSLSTFKDIFTDNKGNYLLPNDIVLNTYSFLCSAARRAGNYKEAEENINVLIKMRPSYPSNYLMQGLIYDDQRKGDLAIESFKKAMELNPYSTLNSYHYSLAIAKYKSISEAAHFLEEKSTFLKKSNQPYAASLVDYYRECQINPPNMPDPPFTQ